MIAGRHDNKPRGPAPVKWNPPHRSRTHPEEDLFSAVAIGRTPLDKAQTSKFKVQKKLQGTKLQAFSLRASAARNGPPTRAFNPAPPSGWRLVLASLELFLNFELCTLSFRNRSCLTTASDEEPSRRAEIIPGPSLAQFLCSSRAGGIVFCSPVE